MPGDKLSNDGYYGITVQTWGTQESQSNGMVNFLDQQLFGGDVGHASINMKLPINDTTCEWIEKYCCKQTYSEYKNQNGEIPYEKYLKEVDHHIPVFYEKQLVRKAHHDESGKMTVRPATYNETMTLQNPEDVAFEQDYFDIDFSWWPTRMNNTPQDMILEREGKHVNYAQQWKEYLIPDQRLHKGKLGQRLMDYAPLTVAHERDLPGFVFERLTRRTHQEKNHEKIRAINTLKLKIDELKNETVSPSMFLMFQNLDVNLQELLNEYKSTKAADNLEHFKSFLSYKVRDIEERVKDELQTLEAELKNPSDLTKIEEKKISKNQEVEALNKDIYELEHNTQIDELIELTKGDQKSLPYTVRIECLLNQNEALKNLIKLENKMLSSQSVKALLDHIEGLIAKHQGSQITPSERKAIAAYDRLVEVHNNDTQAIEDALYEADFGTIDEILEYKERANKKPNNSASEPLENLKRDLLHYQETGTLFSADLELKLDIIPDWSAIIWEPCQEISCDSVNKIKEKIIELKECQQRELGELRFKKQTIEQELVKIEQDLAYYHHFELFFSENPSLYLTLGQPPHHTVSLPFQTDEQRGLSPMEMLKKMHELATDGEKFDLYRKNCSLTSIEILSAGVSHDPHLHQIMVKKALGFFGTPQQVLTNAQESQAAIDINANSNFLTRMFRVNYLDQALGYGINLYMEKEGKRLQQAIGIAIGTAAVIAKVPGITIQAGFNPQATQETLTETLDLVNDRDSNQLKLGLSVLSTPAIAALGAVSIVHKGISVLTNLFQRNETTQKSSLESMDLITTPIMSPSMATDSYTNTALAGLVNQRIQDYLKAHTITISANQDPLEILVAFEKKLQENKIDVVVLSSQAHEQLFSHVLNTKDPEIKQRFYKCCNESTARAQKLIPKFPQIKEMVAEAADSEEMKAYKEQRESTPKHSNSQPANNEGSEKEELSFFKGPITLM